MNILGEGGGRQPLSREAESTNYHKIYPEKPSVQAVCLFLAVGTGAATSQHLPLLLSPNMPIKKASSSS